MLWLVPIPYSTPLRQVLLNDIRLRVKGARPVTASCAYDGTSFMSAVTHRKAREIPRHPVNCRFVYGRVECSPGRPDIRFAGSAGLDCSDPTMLGYTTEDGSYCKNLLLH